MRDRASQVEKRRYWDAAAETFDDEPDHGLRDPMVRNAWTNLLGGLLPPRSRVLDLGCGTGSLSVLLANIGHHVIGADLSTAMIRIARSKAAAAGQDIPFYVCDVSHPGLRTRQFDSILAGTCSGRLSIPEPSWLAGQPFSSRTAVSFLSRVTGTREAACTPRKWPLPCRPAWQTARSLT